LLIVCLCCGQSLKEEALHQQHLAERRCSELQDQLMEIRNFGDTTLDEVRQLLGELGLHLGMKVPQAPVIS